MKQWAAGGAVWGDGTQTHGLLNAGPNLQKASNAKTKEANETHAQRKPLAKINNHFKLSQLLEGFRRGREKSSTVTMVTNSL